MPKSQTKLSNIQTVTPILLVTSCNTMDSYCETSYDNNKDKKIDEICLCKDCNIFLCRPCHCVHKQVRSLQNHRILRGSMMPQTNLSNIQTVIFPRYWLSTYHSLAIVRLVMIVRTKRLMRHAFEKNVTYFSVPHAMTFTSKCHLC